MSFEGVGGLPTLCAHDVACRRGGRLLFKGVHLQVASGDIVWLRGANGRGKTSLLRLACGLSVPEAGQLSWGGDPVRSAPDFHRRLQYVAHASALKDDLSAGECLQFLARLRGQAVAQDRIQAALERLGLAGRCDALVRTLSQGQRRRVALARLAFEPGCALWLLDEPYDALDADGAARLSALLAEHQQRGGSVLLTSHQALSGLPGVREFDLDRYS